MASSDILKILGGSSPVKTLIPDDAERYEPDTNLFGTPSKPAPNDASIKEPLLGVELALVAPDATPNGNSEVSPSLIPTAINTILATPPKPSAPPVPTPTTAQTPQVVASTPSITSLPGIPSVESFASTYNNADIQESTTRAAVGVQESMIQGREMPNHVPSDITRTLDVFRNYARF